MAPGKTRGGSPYNQFDIIPGDTLGGHTGPAGDSWLPAKSPPTNKIGSKSSNASWPPGIIQEVCFGGISFGFYFLFLGSEQIVFATYFTNASTFFFSFNNCLIKARYVLCSGKIENFH